MINIMYVFNKEDDVFNAYTKLSYKSVALALKTEHHDMIACNNSDIYIELVDAKSVMNRRGFRAHIIYVENGMSDDVIEHLKSKIAILTPIDDIQCSLAPIQVFFYCSDDNS